MQELYKEARLMRQYQHINVVGFFGMVMENDNVMIVMEMVNGGGLDHYLKKNTVSIPDKCSYAFDVALGLYYLHSKRCMHRDLACRNCLIDTQKNIVKISDFGLSKQADSYKILPTEKIPTKWQAPEVVATHIYTRECDVYSYGILVWEIFNDAKMPFEEYDNKTVRQRLSDPKFRPPLSEDLPDEIRVVVTACWSAMPDSRPVMKDVAWILKGFQKHK
ncbi:protein tyrosine kinase [Cooperia oncophora]